MLEPEVRELLTRLRRELEALYGERLKGIYLFGSHAREEATPDSDVDVLVVLDTITDYGAEIRRTGPVISTLSLDSGRSISRVFVSHSAWRDRDSPFLANVREDARAA
jgi:type I restriction enzyme S subunit